MGINSYPEGGATEFFLASLGVSGAGALRVDVQP